MNINRHNYEEYFILYLDNELESEERRQVEAFAQENPDLKAELDMLLQSKLTVDTDISFADKDSLLRFDNSSISLSNYEEWLTSYIDDELTEEERKNVEKFVAANPAVQKELNLLQQTKLQPEAIIFPYKESLYRREEKVRVISMGWIRIAAAAVLLLAISTTAIVLINNSKGSDKPVDLAIEQPKQEKSTDNNPGTKPVIESPVNDQQLATTSDNKKESNNSIAVKQTTIKPEEKKDQPVLVKDEEKSFADNNNKEDKPTNNLPKPDDAIASIDPSPKVEETFKGTNVTPTPTDTYNKADGSENENKQSDVTYASQNSGSSNKGVRGFLRKVTRTFEKRTNIKATDDDDRLLIAGLAIKLN